jgi:protoporphyrinogen oxidase
MNDETWRMSDEALAQVVRQSLDRCELPLQARVFGVTTRRQTHAYPLYHHGYEEHFRVVDQWLDGLDGVLSFGRQGLFAHDNIHHALAMAGAAVGCLDDAGRLDQEQWRQRRAEFDKHVVVD